METIQNLLMQQFQNADDAYERYARANGLNYLSLMVLEEIYELGDGCTQKQISEDTRYPKQSINLTVKAFLTEGLIVLKELPENRKNKGITLTDKGRARCDAVIVPMLRKKRQAMEALSDEGCHALLRLLRCYSEAYCAGLDELHR